MNMERLTQEQIGDLYPLLRAWISAKGQIDIAIALDGIYDHLNAKKYHNLYMIVVDPEMGGTMGFAVSWEDGLLDLDYVPLYQPERTGA